MVVFILTLRRCSGLEKNRAAGQPRGRDEGRVAGHRTYTSSGLRLPLHAGTRLGPYEILSPIGAGGMGEVTVPATRACTARSRSRSCPRQRCGSPFPRAVRLGTPLSRPSRPTGHFRDDQRLFSFRTGFRFSNGRGVWVPGCLGPYAAGSRRAMCSLRADDWRSTHCRCVTAYPILVGSRFAQAVASRKGGIREGTNGRSIAQVQRLRAGIAAAVSSAGATRADAQTKAYVAHPGANIVTAIDTAQAR